MENTAIRANIQELLKANENNSQRKTLSLSLPEKLLNELDELCETTASINGKHVTRQSLIESAVDAYVSDFKAYLEQEYAIKVEPDRFDEELDDIDTLIVPARKDGLETLLNNEWYWLRIGKDKVDKIKYLAIYFGHPVSAVTHIAKVDKLIKHPSGYKAQLSDVEELETKIVLDKLSPLYVRPNRYVSRSRIYNAKKYEDLLD